MPNNLKTAATTTTKKTKILDVYVQMKIDVLNNFLPS